MAFVNDHIIMHGHESALCFAWERLLTMDSLAIMHHLYSVYVPSATLWGTLHDNASAP
jgi:hypothetical protein